MTDDPKLTVQPYGPTRRARFLVGEFEAAFGPIHRREKLIEMLATALSFEQLAATPYTRDAPTEAPTTEVKII